MLLLTKMQTLRNLKVGDKAVFLDSPQSEMILKLNQMGIFPGDFMSVKHISPWESSFWIEVENKLEFTVSDKDADMIIISRENVR